jgi:hypothetical protein
MSEEEDDDEVEVSITSDDEKIYPLEDSTQKQEGFASQPAVVREEIVAVAENPNAETFLKEEVSSNTNDTGKVYYDDLYNLVKEHSTQLNRLADIVKSCHIEYID